MAAALADHFDLTVVVRRPWAPWFRPLGRALKALSFRRFDYRWSRPFARLALRGTILRLRTAKIELLFAASVVDIAYLLVDQLPTVFISDVVIPDFVRLYGMEARLSVEERRRMEEAERDAFAGAVAIHFPSEWACRATVQRYGIGEDRFVCIPWGANIPFEEREAKTLGPAPIRLLFVGGDWANKGLLLAVEINAALNRRGIASHLDIAGCSETDVGRGSFAHCTFHGFLGKASPKDREALLALYAGATFFVMPSRIEGFGIVFAEAAHHAVPALAFATGGVPAVVRDGETGILLPLGSSAEEFADRIEQLLDAPAAYRAMSQAALDWAREGLRWEVWAQKFAAEVLARLPAPKGDDQSPPPTECSELSD